MDFRIDASIASYTMISFLREFTVLQQGGFSSDHAPITFTVSNTGVNLDMICEQAVTLHGHVAKRKLVRKHVRFTDINRTNFESNLAELVIGLGADNNDINELPNKLYNELYKYVVISKISNQAAKNTNENLGKLEILAQDKDDIKCGEQWIESGISVYQHIIKIGRLVM